MKGITPVSDVRFVKVENLRGRARFAAGKKGLTKGLALLRTSITSLPQYEVTPVVGDPLEALNGLAMEDGITPEMLSRAFEKAFK